MIRMLLFGLWISGVSLGSTWLSVRWQTSHGKLFGGEDYLEGLEYKKTPQIAVPMIADGVVQGYIVAQLIYTIDAKTLKSLPVPPEAYVQDEAFRAIYADEKLDFRRLQKYDLTKLTADVKTRVNARLSADLVKDVLVQEFNYVPREDAR